MTSMGEFREHMRDLIAENVDLKKKLSEREDELAMIKRRPLIEIVDISEEYVENE